MMQNIKELHLIGENTEEAVKSSVISQCDHYLKQIPVELHEKLERRLPNQSKLCN